MRISSLNIRRPKISGVIERQARWAIDDLKHVVLRDDEGFLLHRVGSEVTSGNDVLKAFSSGLEAIENLAKGRGNSLINEDIVERIMEHCSFIAPIAVYPGEDEMQALAECAEMVLNGETSARIYE